MRLLSCAALLLYVCQAHASTVEEGKQLFEAGEYERAAKVFEQLIELGAHEPDLLYFAGSSRKALGHEAKANVYIDAYLAAPPEGATRLERARRIRQALRRQLRPLAITVKRPPLPPAPLRLTLVATPVDAQHGPAVESEVQLLDSEVRDTVLLTPGQWILTIDEGPLTAEQQAVDIGRARSARASVLLTPHLEAARWPAVEGEVRAALEAEQREQWADAGRAFRHAADATEDPILYWRAARAYGRLAEPGLPVLVMSRQCWQAYRRLQPKAADRSEVDAAIEALSARIVAASGHLRLTLEPADASLLIDGEPYMGDRADIRLSPGPRTIEVSAEGYSSTTIRQTIQAGETYTDHIVLVGSHVVEPEGESTSSTGFVGPAMLGGGLALGLSAGATAVLLMMQVDEPPSRGYRGEYDRFAADTERDQAVAAGLAASGLVMAAIGLWLHADEETK